MLHSVVLHFSPCEWRSIDDLPPRGNEYDDYDERCIVVWQDAEHETDQGVEVTCLAHIRDGDYRQTRMLNPVWRTVMDAPIFLQNVQFRGGGTPYPEIAGSQEDQ